MKVTGSSGTFKAIYPNFGYLLLFGKKIIKFETSCE